MKKKILTGIVLCFMIIFIALSTSAYTVEVDTHGNITMSSFTLRGTKATGTVKTVSTLTGYTVSYQKIDLTKAEYDEIIAKETEAEKKSLIDDPVDANWQAVDSTKEIDNAELDFTGKTGDVYFVLWAKATNGTNTYYRYQIYTSTITATDSETETPAKTDFSKKVISLEQGQDVRNYKLKISGVIPIEGHTYYYAIGDGTSIPEFSTSLEQLSYDKDKKVFYSKDISKYLELGKKQYIYVYESYLNEDSTAVNELVLPKTEIEKPAQKKYTDVFYATMISKLTDTANSRTQILFNTPWDKGTVRKVHVKVGKIEDQTMLKDIQNKKETAFEDLLKYAKKTDGLYDKTLSSNSTGAAGGVLIEERDPLFAANKVQDGSYYFLYAVVEGEEGKYVETEGITLARATKLTSQTNSFSLFFYGSEDFTWDKTEPEKKDPVKDDQNKDDKKDDSTMKGKLPQTGASYIISAIVVIAVVGTISYKKYKKYTV